MQPELDAMSTESLISYQTQVHSVLSATFDQTWLHHVYIMMISSHLLGLN